MFSVIFRHELQQLGKSRPTIALFFLLVAAFVFAAWNGERAVEKHVRGTQLVIDQQAAKKQSWLDDLILYEDYVAEQGIPMQIAPPAYRPAPYGKPALGTNAGTVGEKVEDVAVLPPNGLSAFSVGQLDLQRGYSLINMKSKFFISDNYEIENPVNLSTGTFDISFVVLFLLPIFILALTYDLLSGEREAGTLALIQTQRVSMRVLMAAKICARASIFVAVILFSGLIAFAYGATGTIGFGFADSAMRLVLWFAAVLVYSFFWFALGVRVNMFRKSSEANATILSCAWLSLVIIVPTLVSLVATSLYPAPSRMMLKVSQRAAFAEAEANLDETKRKFYIEHAEMVPDEDLEEYTLSFVARQEAMDIAVEPVYKRFEQQKEKQEKLVDTFQYASPAIVVQLALNDISGTSSSRFSVYLQQVYAYHAERKDYFLPKYINRQIMTSDMFSEFPEFKYVQEDISELIYRVTFPLFLLLVSTLLIYPRRISVVQGDASRDLYGANDAIAGLGKQKAENIQEQ
ncbi:MAG TPA: DUF3526 domain-containing protein [Gammaproteobacteria bacterium]|jgi:ABC-2 type transport system permease protein|nr:hypothetical protein [Chromatiales bacterium]HJP39767.1 DUF3526 domain-containing protein [Gammaproteobacteria bacterium]